MNILQFEPHNCSSYAKIMKFTSFRIQKHLIRPISVIKIKSTGFSARNQRPERKKQDCGSYFQETRGHFYKTAKRRGTWCPRPSDLGSMAELRSKRERARARANKRAREISGSRARQAD
jgi:hypothetical protein